MKQVNIGKNWRIHEAPLGYGVNSLQKVLDLKDGWLEYDLPCDVRMPLIRENIILDPVISDYSYSSQWIEERSWWFVKKFNSSELDFDSDITELVIESIDAHGEIFLNGTHLGTHISTHYPFERDIKNFIVPGENTLTVCVTTGLETVSDRDLAELNHACCHEEGNGCPDRGDKRRAFLRKPQYTVGWDWNPRIVSCGITKGAFIRCVSGAVVRNVSLETKQTAPDALLHAGFEIEYLDITKTSDADIYIDISYNGSECATASLKDVLLTAGANYFDCDLFIKNARLWWPNGYGEQPLYDVKVKVVCNGHFHEYPAFKYGIRTVSLDVSRLDEKNRKFELIINGVGVYCKGGNYIPSDSIYARVDEKRHEKLVKEAAEANFNMLRVWGGGIYETDDFYALCDKYGILLWHDLMFGCSTYPDHLGWFQAEVEKELDYQTKRLGNHPCMALWCGNNEDHWIFNPEENPKWNIDLDHNKQYGLYISNHTAKKAVKLNCPHIPYWNSSPFGGSLPNDEEIGDTHHWHKCMMNPDMAKRIEPFEYDTVNAKFVSEYGYPGPVPKVSLLEYMGDYSAERGNKVWDLHTNTFEKFTVAAGIKKHYGVDSGRLDIDNYILYAGLVQMTMLNYSLEAFRFNRDCFGGMFWMYNDAWGEVGWTILDYYLRRKIAFYGVRRAFEPVKLLARKKGNEVVITGCNDTPEDITITADVGIISLNSSDKSVKEISFVLKARNRQEVYRAILPEYDDKANVFAIIPKDEGVTPAVLRSRDIYQLSVGGAKLSAEYKRSGKDMLVTVTADKYAHGVYIEGNYEVSDNYFDLLPGQKKVILVKNCDKEPEIKKIK